MDIRLTDEQVRALQPLQRQVVRCSEEGGVPALFAQVFPLQRFVEVRFIDTDTADEIYNVLSKNGHVR